MTNSNKANNGNIEKIVAALNEFGPLSLKQLAEETRLTPTQIYNAIYVSPRVHVVKWEFGLNPHKIGHVALYGISPGPNKRKPSKQSYKILHRRYMAKKAAKQRAIRMNSVFNLGATV